MKEIYCPLLKLSAQGAVGGDGAMLGAPRCHMDSNLRPYIYKSTLPSTATYMRLNKGPKAWTVNSDMLHFFGLYCLHSTHMNVSILYCVYNNLLYCGL